MKVIDLLNKIANGEDIPKKIKYYGCIFELHNRVSHFYNYRDNKGKYFEDEWFLTNILNDEIEIIEDTPKEETQVLSRYSPPKDDKKIKRLGKCFFTEYDDIFSEWVAMYNGVIVDKLNEIIDRLNGEDNE